MAIDGYGAASPVAERKVVLDSDPGTGPTLTYQAGTTGGVVGVVPGETRPLVFEMTSDGTNPPAPTAMSPRLQLPLAVDLPFGARRTFKVRAASLDAAGRGMAAGPVLSFVVNRKPPGRPAMSPAPGAVTLDEPTSLTLSSPASVWFTVTADGTTPPDPRPVGPASGTVIPLAGKDGAVVAYQVKLVAADAAGNVSEVYGPYAYTVDLRTPLLPALAGIRDGGRYNARSLSASPSDVPWKTYYTYTTDGSVPADPGTASAQLTGATTFSGEEGTVTTFRVRLVAVSQNGKRTGEKREISFTIDLKPPDVPGVSGAADGVRYARPVTVVVDAAPADVAVYYSVSTTDEDAPDPVTNGKPVSGPLSFDVPVDAQRDFTLRLASLDDAGNRSLYDRRIHFTIDRELPDDPVVSGAPENGLSDRPVTLTVSSTSTTVVYELTDDGTMPRLPTPASTPYVSPLLLSGKAGAVITYRLLPRAMDDLGNASRAARMTTVTVDRTVPAAPALPRVTWSAENPGTAYFSWDQPALGRLFYRVRAGGAANGEFVPYDGPVAVPISLDGNTVTVDAVVRNPAGTASDMSTLTRVFGGQLAAPSFRGARNGGVYAQKVDVRPDPSAGVIRYSLATDGSFPEAVTASSAPFPASLTLDAADGQTVEWKIAARAFDSTGVALPSPETVLDVTIDHTPPD
ncbi:MAG TPA: hypothetical protein VMV18_06285, partial [bacterium]|nr:hypothetical protein [bacterium]